MLDVDTFLTILYVIVDDLCQPHASQQRRPGPPASLSESEVITLAIFARWSRFSSERDFYRYAEAHLRGAFPTLPDRSQFNRLARSYGRAIEEIAVKLARLLEGEARPYQALDSSAMPVRDAKRRGHGWLAGQADIGWSNSIGWYEGFSLLAAIEPSGVITGFLFRECLYRRSAIGRNLLRGESHSPPEAHQRGLGLLGHLLRDRQRLRGRREPSALARMLRRGGRPSAQAQL
jgi:hypothetical protein